ncbi:MAG: sugar-binding protein [Verrucomicrobiae bacterium]|nr:sugar-binding protein [Verrucomicrobiae bacterium]
MKSFGGLAAYWKMDEITPDNHIEDASGHGNHAMVRGILGTLTLIDGKMGKALFFDGTGAGYLEVSRGGNLSKLTEFTVTGWVKYVDLFGLENEGRKYPTFFCRGWGDSCFPQFWFFTGFNKSAAAEWSFRKMAVRLGKKADGKTFHAVSRDLKWEKDRWYHLAATVSAKDGKIRFYRDGEEAGNGDAPPDYHFGCDKIFIGSYLGSKDHAMKGMIDEVKIHDLALTRAEIEKCAAIKTVMTKVPKIEKTPPLDGTLPAGVWQTAAACEPFMVFKKGEPAEKQTRGLLAYDKKCFYIGLVCQEPAPSGIKAEKRPHDDEVWCDDCVEIFIDAEGKGKSYAHFAVNAAGSMAEEKCVNLADKDLKNWNPPWTAVVTRNKTDWRAEIAIPFASLGIDRMPENGTVWGISLNRSTRGTGEQSGWPNGAFHRPDKFGKVVFSSYRDGLDRVMKELETRCETGAALSSAAGDEGIRQRAAATIRDVKRKTAEIRGRIESQDGDFSSEICRDLFDEAAMTLRELGEALIELRCQILLDRLGRRENWSAKEKDQVKRDMAALAVDAEESVFKGTKSYRTLKSEYWQFCFNSPCVMWKKSSVWDNLPVDALPDIQQKPVRDIRVEMGINEYRSESFVISNLTRQEMSVTVRNQVGALPVIIRVGYPIQTIVNKAVNDPLPLLEKLVIPPCESREVWLTIKSHGLKAGEHKMTLLAQPNGFSASAIEVKVKVLPIELPVKAEEIPLDVALWDYVGGRSYASKTKEEMKGDLLDHYATVLFLSPSSIPWPTYDRSGKMNIDYAECGKALDFCLAGKKPRVIGWYWNFRKSGGKNERFGKDFMSAEWKDKFSVWYKEFIAYLAGRGLAHDQFLFHVFDETTDKIFCDFAAFLKSLDSKVRIIVNPSSHSTSGELSAMAPYANVWMPYLYLYLKEGKKTDLDFMRKTNDLWSYVNVPGGVPQAASPYAGYRVPLWQIWQSEMKGVGNWVYLYSPDKSWAPPKDGRYSWDLVYLSEKAPRDVSRKESVIPSKRWEAWREGITDYMYLDTLRKAIGQARAAKARTDLIERAEEVLRKWPAQVIEKSEQNDLADEARTAVMREILKLKDGMKLLGENKRD